MAAAGRAPRHQLLAPEVHAQIQRLEPDRAQQDQVLRPGENHDGRRRAPGTLVVRHTDRPSVETRAMRSSERDRCVIAVITLMTLHDVRTLSTSKASRTTAQCYRERSGAAERSRYLLRARSDAARRADTMGSPVPEWTRKAASRVWRAPLPLHRSTQCRGEFAF